MQRTLSLALLTITAALIPGVAADEIVINGKPLDGQEMQVVRQLEQMYGAKAIPGNYWYDPVSGAYGADGQPMLGQLPPNLRLGGRLRANASNGNTNVFVNGRELHRTEVARLQTCTQVIPGRYWVDSHGNGGVEGGPMMFNLTQLCRQSSSYRSRYGSVLSDGTTSGAFFRNSNGSYTSVTCGPDGGCIY